MHIQKAHLKLGTSLLLPLKELDNKIVVHGLHVAYFWLPHQPNLALSLLPTPLPPAAAIHQTPACITLLLCSSLRIP